MQINLQFRVALLKVVGCAAPLTCDSNFCLLSYMRGSLSAHTTRRRRLVESEFAHALVDRYPKIVITVTICTSENLLLDERGETKPIRGNTRVLLMALALFTACIGIIAFV